MQKAKCELGEHPVVTGGPRLWNGERPRKPRPFGTRLLWAILGSKQEPGGALSSSQACERL
jgi:hypothetical protein